MQQSPSRLTKIARWKIIRLAQAALVICLLALLTTVGVAGDYPSRPIILVHPYPPGGSGDFISRLFADFLSRILNQPLVVENRPGASGNVGLEHVARSNPDGYTLLFGTSQPMINMAFGPAPPVDTLTAFEPIAIVGEMPFVIAANRNSGIATAKDLVSKANAQRTTIGNAQFDGQIKLLQIATGTKLDVIPYKGGAASVLAAISGEVTLVGAYVPVLMSQINADKLLGVGIAAKTRISVLPNVPTFAEQGYPEFETTVWFDVLAPKGTPQEILEALRTASLAVAKNPEYINRLRAGGGEPLALDAKETQTVMLSEARKWADVANAKQD
jgi:tripartite-type tricarboxylate transporter receptor subunit TctC